MGSKVKIAFVGTGGMGQCAHLRNYASLREECEVIALAELRPDLGARVACKYGVPKVYASATELLKNERPDGLVASQPFSRHGVLLEELLDAGVPIFIEKPLAHSVPVAERILRKVAERSGRVMVGYHKRSDPATEYAVAAIREFRESGAIGALRYVRILMPAGDWVAGGFFDLLGSGENPGALAFDPPPEDMDAETFPAYTSFVNYYIHQVNLMRHLLGEEYRVTYAEPTGILLAGASNSGIPCVIEMSPYTTTIDWQESAMVAFEHGTVSLKLPAPLALNRPGEVEVFTDPGNGITPETRRPALPWVHAMKNQAVNFLEFVRGNREAPCRAEEAIKDLQVAREYIRLRAKA